MDVTLDRPARSDRLPLALLAYALALALLLIVPPFLKDIVGPPAGFTLQEAVDLFTPLVAIPLAWLVVVLAGGVGRLGTLAFLVLAAAWVEGQAIHLAANAIGDAFGPGGAEDFYATVPGDLDYWLDEVLGHWLWHGPWVGIALFQLVVGRRAIAGPGRSAMPIAVVAGLIIGATFFLVTVEGQTTALGIPCSIAILAWTLVEARRGPARRPVVSFSLVSAATTLAGYLAWAALNGGRLPEFSKVGLFG